MVSPTTTFEGGPLDWGLKLGWHDFQFSCTISGKQCEIELT